MTRKCTVCAEHKDLTEFPRSSVGKNGREYLRTRCKICYSAQQLDRGRRNQYRLKKYGLTLPGYNKLLVAQDYKCHICGKPHQEIPDRKGGQGRLHVDHDHKTGNVRGLLCLFCNRMLGLARDNPQILMNATGYLREHTPDGAVISV